MAEVFRYIDKGICNNKRGIMLSKSFIGIQTDLYLVTDAFAGLCLFDLWKQFSTWAAQITDGNFTVLE